MTLVPREDLSAWRGLPAGATPESLGADREALAMGLLGEERAFRASAAIGGDEAVVWWLPHDGDRVALVELLDPQWADVGPLGEPAARLDTWVGDFEAPGGEWVWPDRGVAALVSPRTGAVAVLRLFAPTTLDAYPRPDVRPRRLPMG